MVQKVACRQFFNVQFSFEKQKMGVETVLVVLVTIFLTHRHTSVFSHQQISSTVLKFLPKFLNRMGDCLIFEIEVSERLNVIRSGNHKIAFGDWPEAYHKKKVFVSPHN